MFYLSIFNIILFVKQGIFQSSMPIVILSIFLLSLQFFVFLTNSFADRRRNKWLILIFLLLSVYMLQACSTSEKIDTSPSSSELLVSSEGMENIEKDSIVEYHDITSSFHQLTIDEIEMDNFSKNSLLFLGKASCPHCRDFIPFFQKTISDLNIDSQIYYYNVEGISEEDKKKLLEKYPTIEGVPALMYIKEDGSYDLLDETSITLPEWLMSLKNT